MLIKIPFSLMLLAKQNQNPSENPFKLELNLLLIMIGFSVVS